MIYLDHNATTPVHPEVIDCVARVQRDAFGNPGSRHIAGRTARRALEQARESIAALLGASPQQLVFTSGGTESINLSLSGLAARVSSGANSRSRVAAPLGEHSATLESIRRLTRTGWQSTDLPIDEQGQLDASVVATLAARDAQLVTLLLAHNETGVVQQIGPLRDWCNDHRILWHIDAVQAVGKIPVDFAQLGASALSFAAHKFGGPRGIGGLLVREESLPQPLLVGGHQESGRRAGTECTALAAGMALALELQLARLATESHRVGQLRERLEAGLHAACGQIHVHGGSTSRLPNTACIAFPGCGAEALLVQLDLLGVCCSAGSTCSSGSVEEPPVLVAMGAPPETRKSTVRFSLGWTTTQADVDIAIQRIAGVVTALRAAVADQD